MFSTNNTLNYILDYDHKSTSEEFDPLMDDYEAAELGKCKEVISDELYMPCHKSRDWVRCFIATCAQPDCYRLYLDNNRRRFLLSAKQFSPGVILISTHEDFPMIDMKPKKGFVARVEQQSDSSYLICLNRCHLCDGKLGRFTCGRSCEEREIVGKVSHTIRRLSNPAGVDFRCISVTIPIVSDSGMRKIWCPRSFKISFPNEIGNHFDINEAVSRYITMGVKYVNKLPEWNEDLKSLVLKFQGNRVLTASAKNFLLYAEKYSKMETSRSLTVSKGSRSAFDESHNECSNMDNNRFRSNTSSSLTDSNHSYSNHTYNSEESGKFSNLIQSTTTATTLTTSSSPTITLEDLSLDNTATNVINNNTNNHTHRSRSKTTVVEEDLTSRSHRPRARTRSNRSDDTDETTSLSTPVARSHKSKKKPIAACDATDVAIMQFGKSSSSRYVLDFKYPLSPIQAFGVALSAFSFQDNFERNIKFSSSKR
mmetsp:Transcript_10680/g.16088  ORF Transcript_10680/g.16088 Transcript_10680/m.16088 type:complete len:481 (+) Transcript_10680:1112-2554(+)